MDKTKSVMKVLFFIEGMTAGGKERRLTELMKALKLKPDIQFELVVMTKEVHYREIFDLDIKIHYLIRNGKKDMSIFQRFFRICRNYKPDVVHCWDSMTAVYSAPVCKLLNIKFVNGMVVDTPMPQNMSNVHWRRARLTFPFSNVIIGNSKAGLSGYNAPVRKSICIHNGMDLRRFEKVKDSASMIKEMFGTNSRDICIAGMVAQFDSERKDYMTLIEAAKTLISSNKNLRFILVGEGPDLNTIKDSVPQSLVDSIIFPGKRSDVESIVNIFDIGILLTNTKLHGEGISNAIIEYMALGKPVIATRSGGTEEIVEDQKTGFLISPFCSPELMEKMEILIKDPDSRNKMGQAGRERIHRCFSIDKMVNKFISVYN
jgi:glycosyltransferase involved in cell wall biosynthesis